MQPMRNALIPQESVRCPAGVQVLVAPWGWGYFAAAARCSASSIVGHSCRHWNYAPVCGATEKVQKTGRREMCALECRIYIV